MAECVDQEARDRIAKLWTAYEQHSTDWWGPDKTNGKRSELVSVLSRIGKIESDFKHFTDTKESECIGLSALNGYIESKEEEEEQMVVEREKGRFLMRMQWLQFVGIILVALIGLLR